MDYVEGLSFDKKARDHVLTDGRIHGFDLLESFDRLLKRYFGSWFQTNQGARISMRLLSAGVELPASVDLASLLMAEQGLSYLQKICAGFDISEVETLTPPSRWIVVCLFRTVPSCYDSIIRQLQGFPAHTLEYYTDLRRLISEINTSQESFRNYFLLSLSVGGTTRTVEPLVTAALELGAHAPYFVEQALKHNNTDVALLFLKFGTVLSPDTAIPIVSVILEKLGHSQATRSAGRVSEFLEVILKMLDPLPELQHDHQMLEILDRFFVSSLYSTNPSVQHSESGDRDPGDDRVSRMLIEAGLYHSLRSSEHYWNEEATPTHTPLMLAIALKRTSIIRLLLEHGYDANELLPPGAPDYTECFTPPLSYAIWLGLPDIVKVLLQAGADVTKKGRSGIPPWRISAACCEKSHPRFADANLGSRFEEAVSEIIDTQIFTEIRSHLDYNKRPTYRELDAEWQMSVARGETLRPSGKTIPQCI